MMRHFILFLLLALLAASGGIATAFATGTQPMAPASTPGPVLTPTGRPTDLTPAPITTSLIRHYYAEINAHHYRQAYADLESTARPSYANFAAGYQSTAQVSLTEVVGAPYRIEWNGNAYSCVAVGLTARQQNGQTSSYGGWYLVIQVLAPWRILLPGSHLVHGGKPILPSSAACLQAAQQAAAGPCVLGDLLATVSLQGATGSLAGSLVLRNHTSYACILQGVARVQLRSHGHRLPIRQRSPALSRKVVLALPADGKTQARLVWSNWCHGRVRNPLVLRLSLRGVPGVLRVPIRLAPPPANTPRCNVRGQPSSLEVSAFQTGTTSHTPVAARADLAALSFANRRNGWVSTDGPAPTLFHTGNGGASWQQWPAPAVLTQLQFINATQGWALGVLSAGCARSDCRGALYRTTNGGRSWQRRFLAPRCFSTEDLQFINARRGWFVARQDRCAPVRGHAILYTSGDGGLTWRPLATFSQEVTGLHFGDAVHGFLAERLAPCTTHLLATADGGRLWRQQLTTPDCQTSVDAVNRHDAWALTTLSSGGCSMSGCWNDRLYRTTDGVHWRLQHAGQPDHSLWSGQSGFPQGVVFVTPRVGWIPVDAGAASGMGGVDITTNGGASWTRRLTSYSVRGLPAVSILSPAAGWLIGCDYGHRSSGCHTLLHTTNAGRSWQPVIP